MNERTDTVLNIPHLEHYAFSRQYDYFHDAVKRLFEYTIKAGNLECRYRVDPDDPDGGPKLVKGGLTPLHEDMPLKEREYWYHRLATAFSVYLSDPNYAHSDEQLTYINLFKPVLQTVFYVSHYNTMDTILWHRGLVNSEDQLELTRSSDINYVLATQSIHSSVDIDYRKLLKTVPNNALHAYIGMLSRFYHPFDEKARNNFAKIFRQHAVMAEHPAPMTLHVSRVVPGWMNCTYWDISDRHEFKRSANAMIKNWLNTMLTPGTLKKAARNSANKRPIRKIVIASEKYTSGHAVYRCYHSRIAALKEHFETILVSHEKDYDETSAADFHRVVDVPLGLGDIQKTVDTILDLQPDLILYPSLGMAPWTIGTCNIRLAPIQVMSYGHPASSYTETIDYGIIGGIHDGPDYQSFLEETLAPQRLKERPHKLHPEYSPEMQQNPSTDGIIRIAVNSTLPKISLRVINLCALLERESSKTLEFHFFPAAISGANHTALEKSLAQRLASPCVVHRAAKYPQYMEELSGCDLAIGTFPFGGTNTNVDTLMLGIPKFSYTEGSDIASYTDLHELKALDLVEEFNSDNEMQLIAKLLHVIESPEALEYCKRKLKENKPYSFIDDNDLEDRNQIVDAIEWIAEQEDLNS